MQMHRHAQRTLRGRHAGDVIDVRMRQQDVPDRQRVPLRKRQQRHHFVAGIDQHRFARRLASDDEPVLEEGADRLGLQYHEDHDSRGA